MFIPHPSEVSSRTATDYMIFLATLTNGFRIITLTITVSTRAMERLLEYPCLCNMCFEAELGDTGRSMCRSPTGKQVLQVYVIIPTALTIDRRPRAGSDRFYALRILGEENPGAPASLDDFVIAVPDDGAELVGA